MIARRKKPPYSTELYRQEGVQFRSVRLSVEDDGSVRLDTQDMGELVEQTWGDEDYEFLGRCSAHRNPEVGIRPLT